MSLIVWNNALYSVKVDRFDDDHKKLVEFINQLHVAMLQGKGKDILKEILVELQAYTHYHFSEEEKEMQSVGYPEYEEHAKLHRNLKDQLSNFIEDFENNKMEVSIQTFRFLKEWLFNHIQVADKKYAPWLQMKGTAL